MSGTTDGAQENGVQYPGTEAVAAVNKRGRPRRVLNELDTSRDELIAALRSLDKTPSQASELAVNADRDKKKIRLITLYKKKLNALCDGTPYQKAECHDDILELRKTKRGRSIDPSQKLEDGDFLTRFVKDLEDSVPPGGNRDFSLWPRSSVRISTAREKRERDARIARGFEQLRRNEKAKVNRFITGDPDASVFNDLQQRIVATDPATWATLRELKLATGIPERAIRGIIANLRPAPSQAEIVRMPFRHKFIRRGPMPKRHGPRLVIGVLNEFVNRLPHFRIANEDQKRLRKIAMRTQMVIAARFSRLLPST